MRKPLILVSGCLVGLRCRYDGRGLSNTAVEEMVSRGGGIIVCPEQLGGLPTPRTVSQIVGGDGFDVLLGKARVVSEDGIDVTEHFLRGAEETLRLAQLVGVKKVIFQDKSPSCGVRKIYRGKRLVAGCGVTTALLSKEGYDVEPVEESE